MKTKKRLTNEEAEYLGFKVKPKQKCGNPRYFLSDDQLLKLNNKRFSANHSISGKSTLRDNEGNVILEWTKTNTTQQDRLNALKTAVDALKEEIQPINPVQWVETTTNDKLCNQYTLTDYHLGMMSWYEETGDDWDLKIAEDILIKFFDRAVKESPNAEQCILAQIGDFLHWDGLEAVTPTSKHILDVDTRFSKLVRVAIRVLRQVIEMLLNKYKKVTLIMAEGNHDIASSVWLREAFYSFYDNEPRLEIDTNPDPYYCVTFGDNCLFYHHGHIKNLKNIDTVFVSKFKKEFGSSRYVYAHTGHKHHEVKVESNLMILEQHPTLSAKDAHASRNGYLSKRNSKVITYHQEYGEVKRSTISINMLK